MLFRYEDELEKMMILVFCYTEKVDRDLMHKTQDVISLAFLCRNLNTHKTQDVNCSLHRHRLGL